jgi:hypothetical protein
MQAAGLLEQPRGAEKASGPLIYSIQFPGGWTGQRSIGNSHRGGAFDARLAGLPHLECLARCSLPGNSRLIGDDDRISVIDAWRQLQRR